jgi:hypothetical protein
MVHQTEPAPERKANENESLAQQNTSAKRSRLMDSILSFESSSSSPIVSSSSSTSTSSAFVFVETSSAQMKKHPLWGRFKIAQEKRRRCVAAYQVTKFPAESRTRLKTCADRQKDNVADLAPWNKTK